MKKSNPGNKNLGSFQKFVDKKESKKDIASKKNSRKTENKERKLNRDFYKKETEFKKEVTKKFYKKDEIEKPVFKKKEEENVEHFEKMPLNKYIAHCGVCSRREAVDIIKKGDIKVNDKVILEPGYKVESNDKILYKNEEVKTNRNFVYILLNKPKGFITTTEDPQGRKTVLDLVSTATSERIYPIGRLDRNTTGILLLTNDGDFAQKLSHPRNNVKKIYHATLNKDLTQLDFEKIKKGLTLDDGPVSVDAIEYQDLSDKKEIGLEIHLGRNRIVRRIFESLNYEVEKLDRVMFAGLTKKNVTRGKWRYLSKQEIITLKHIKKM